MSDILTMQKLQDGCPVMVAKIPEQILAEIDLWVEESRGLKENPLASLKAHENVGYKAIDGKAHNSYQCSISPHLIEQSFWLAWVLKLTAKYWGMGKHNRNFKLRKWDGHFDGYDIWTNFAYKGDDNPIHHHVGHMSAIIYVKDEDGQPTIFPSINYVHAPKEGEMLLFPAHLEHKVNVKQTESERITTSFNLCVLQESN